MDEYYKVPGQNYTPRKAKLHQSSHQLNRNSTVFFIMRFKANTKKYVTQQNTTKAKPSKVINI